MRTEPRSGDGAVGQDFGRLYRAIADLHREHTLESVLQLVVDSAREVIGARYAALGVLDETGTRLAKFVTSGVSDELKKRIGPLPEGKGILGLLITKRKPLRLADLTQPSAAHGFPEHHPAMSSFLGVPIAGRSGPMGNLYLTEKEGAPEFSAEDEAVATMLASQAAVACENAQLHETSAKLLTELRDAQVSRDRFYAMINHELRNALTAVYGWSDLLLRKMGDSSMSCSRVCGHWFGAAALPGWNASPSGPWPWIASSIRRWRKGKTWISRRGSFSYWSISCCTRAK